MGALWWIEWIERRAYARLQALRHRGLWDGEPPVPVDHVLEHLLDLTISYEMIEEDEGEEILGCLRPATREVVLNERHLDRFRTVPGAERFTKAHEGGHADLFAVAALETEQIKLFVAATYKPRFKSATKGTVQVLGVQLTDRLKGKSREVRTEVMRRLRERDRERQASGTDSPMERRAVDHYAATLLMPSDLVSVALQGRDLSRWATIEELAQAFQVSKQAFRIRLEQLGFVFGVDEHNRIISLDPRHADQGTLL